MTDSTSTGINLNLDILSGEHEVMQKQDPADLDTVSTNATASATFSGSDSDVKSNDEQVPSVEEEDGKKLAESTEAKGTKKAKGERRNRRSQRPGTNTMLYTKAMYKRRFCAHFPDVSACKRGSQCAFAHSRAEFRGSLLPADEEHEGEHSDDFYMNRYKTLWCPIGVQHDWQNCVYAHNYLDIRRNPAIGYGPRQCPHWDKSNSKTAYAERCPNGVRCPYAHGAKEQLYHPAHFKTVVCWDMMSPEGCPRAHLCAFHHNKDECRVEITKDMEYDYTKPLDGKQVGILQKDFNTPPPIGTDLENTKPAPHQKKAPVPPAPAAPAAPAPAPAPTPPSQVPVMFMMMPQMPHGLPVCPPVMQMAMQPQMIAAGAQPQNAGSPTMAPPVMMMPMPMAQMPAQGNMRPANAAMVPEQMMGHMPVPVNAHTPNQYAGRPFGMPDARDQAGPAGGAYPQQQCWNQPTFRELCSPTGLQSSEAYEQYVRDIMNADGDEFQFDGPRKAGAMMVMNRMPASDVSTDEGAWSYGSRSSSLGLSP